jgi:hypothetical protein
VPLQPSSTTVLAAVEKRGLQHFPFIWDHLAIPHERETP